jgi:polyphosphate kinase
VRTTLTRVSPHVHARSLVGRFLEHARAPAFRGDGSWELWRGSFDAMPRNFDARYELAFPVLDPSGRDLVLRALRAQLRDDVNAYELGADGHEEPRWAGGHDCQRLERARKDVESAADPAPAQDDDAALEACPSATGPT